MEFKELKNKKKSELHRILSETRDKLRDLRFKDANKQLKNVREIRLIKQTISRVLTLLNKKDELVNKKKDDLNKEVEELNKEEKSKKMDK
ncbi:50S ribosomal protein L29 [Candidatus Falkowbacteria bacterium RIFOXYB2_FULL_34_18]|uniref:Large ribosomal subunit protein uL29 n=1 Tax=Candidatus Falkowbacteria bacterium RIFOXYD2_FULL_34_120 TaxID=1798007 RepID=A0A1F5TSB8_9BACT|nr:MAG: 50S ribosomal protein L29 [Candidatus Falkowbacteria bacterium RIFOXYB2_FULL_34_18]OGF30061.1 MAG: 50S ribosomal protein L29 [Candidatus Falkowbacteria bacterium RIFOXYC12_FULL_34_55]OGF37606.1 MAG: 50S ribosomal protein L29 [Candidatus Falkowbacteria bacterium RIFOXYC2_FULL_34_220]OGF39361.1 MAG: 50S ribosomal protein L29 [Candidatus Falkowbacteria bacterium RIFOXYD12_FULL_34_57]OGF41866.1 MAG: 50S ribosomal protein L29 [Candidatus Falkowbacteria bacterium RIFOXYD2_FULL_34_120]